MGKCIAIIRGVNVGGHNRVNMKLLREALENAGLDEVQTYIQSGNIVFRSGKKNPESLIKNVLKTEFAVDVPVIVREDKDWKQTVRKNPFLKETDDLTKLLVTFLSATPAAAETKALSEHKFPHDTFKVVGRDVYLYCKEGYGKTDIPNTFFEKRLK